MPLPVKKSKHESKKDRYGENYYQSKKYQEACKEIDASVQRYIATNKLTLKVEEEENEEELLQDEILDKVFKSYTRDESLTRTDNHLQDALQNGGLVCLICIENIVRIESIWSCEECFCSFHLPCIQKWGKDSIFLQSQALEDLLASNPHSRDIKKDFVWCCPKCRYAYVQPKIPSIYKCFCSKKIEPQFDPWLIPHSCGEKCEKRLRPECGHSCLLLCHPGPCPPCPTMMKVSCFCGQTPSQMRRCSTKEWSCNLPCGKLLGCNHHKCGQNCHPGGCPPCPHLSAQKCNCGSSTQMRTCADPLWQCDKKCGKSFSCGHHTCQEICHSGTCGDCPSGGERTCPCGRNSHTLSCTQSIPTCGDTCSKLLACAHHHCQERCHKGECPPCRQHSVKFCSCGFREKEVPCWKDFTCEIKCKKIRDCKRHTCNKKCCTECPPCNQSCGRTLGCGSHKCESRCHLGRCYPCYITHNIFCACGKTSITVPCGRERKTPPPKCNFNCRKPPDCHHPKRESHKCHSGACPRCRIVCDLTLSCSHKCPANCHDAVPVKIANTEKPVGPWEVKTAQVEIRKLPHPPCKVPVPNTCLGKHETQQWACSEVRPFSCGAICGRRLACSNHLCEKECHLVEGDPSVGVAGTNCTSCSLPCKKPRPEGCTHVCMLSCHTEKCPPCTQRKIFKCHCGILDIALVCREWLEAPLAEKDKIRSCTNQCNKQISCGHNCMKRCHGGDCSDPNDCKKKIIVRCPCKRLKKDFPCHAINSGSGGSIACDSVCIENANQKKKEEEEERKKKEEEEEKIRQKELQMYQRFLEGGKRKKQRKVKEKIVEEVPWWKERRAWIISGLVLLLSLVLYIIVGAF